MFPELNFETVAIPNLDSVEKCSALSLGLPCFRRIRFLHQSIYEPPVNLIITHLQTNAMEFKD